MTVETEGAKRVPEDAFSRFKQSHAEIRRAIADMKQSLSERRAACPALREVPEGEPPRSRTTDGGSGRHISVPRSPSASLIPTVDVVE